MRHALALVAVSLWFGCKAAPSPAAAPVHDPLRRPLAPSLPAGVTSCAVLGAEQAGQRCRFFDVAAQRFTDAVDDLTRRAYLYDRALDLYATVEGQVVNRDLTEAMAPGDPESRWGDERYLSALDGYGDSALWTATAGISAALRYASTGTDADRARLERYTRASLSHFEVTGVDGFLARFHYAGVAPGTKIRNGYAMAERGTDSDPVVFDVAPAIASRLLPGYYAAGVPTGNGDALTPARPTWRGGPSVDAYAGPTAFFPLAAALLDDADLKARLGHQLACFLSRLKLVHIKNLSKNAQLQSDLAHYLNSGYVQLDAGDPDLAHVDDIWGLYLPHYTKDALPCPAAPATDAAKEDVFDASADDFEFKLVQFIGKQGDAGTIAFAYFPSVRGGDAAMVRAYALAAAYLTGDPAWVDWRDNVLDAKTNAREASRTVGALKTPKACATYFRTHNVATAHYVALLLDADPASRAFSEHVWRRDFHEKELAGWDNALFEIMYAGALGETTAESGAAVAALAPFGGSEGHLDDPRRNYDVDDEAMPVAGYLVTPPPDAEVKLCEAGVKILGIPVPGPKIDPSSRWSDKALPPMKRVPSDFLWQRDPFDAVRHFGDPGREQFPGLDFTEPYWVARYHGLVANPHIVLAWAPAN